MKNSRLAPALTALAVALVYLGWVLLRSGGDPLEFARIGTRFSLPDPAGTEGYDGQFNYYMASDPDPASAAEHLDVPAYRYQRILYPVLARVAALGQPGWIPWTLPALNLLFLAVLTGQCAGLLVERGASPWYALLIGLWPGTLLAVRADLAEPLALLLIVFALRAAGPSLDKRPLRTAGFLALALLAKETMLPFVAGFFVWHLLSRNRRAAAINLLPLIPFAAWQIWLWFTFGAPGLGSGGAGNTPFEVLPLAGFFKIAPFSLRLFAILAAAYLPGILVPAVYGLWAPARDFVQKRISPEAVLLFFNAAIVVWAPFSTFREPLGILRLASGLILCLWLFAARNNLGWWKKLSVAGLAYLAFIAG